MDKQILCDHCIAIISLFYFSSTTLTLHTTGFVTKFILESNGPNFFLKKARKIYTEKNHIKDCFKLKYNIKLNPMEFLKYNKQN